jgi:hypothetical protein
MLYIAYKIKLLVLYQNSKITKMTFMTEFADNSLLNISDGNFDFAVVF